MLVGAPGAIGELYRMGLAQHDHARVQQLARQGGSMGGHPFAPDGAAAGGDMAFQLYQVLERDGNPVQRPQALAGPHCLVCRFGRQPRLRRVKFDKGLQLGFLRRDPHQAGFHHIDRGKAARGKARG